MTEHDSPPEEQNPPPAQELRICYLTRSDPAQFSDWSGTPYWTVRHLRARGHTVDVLRGEPGWARWLLAPAKAASWLIRRHYLLRHADLYHAVLKPFLRRKLAGRRYDVVFCQDLVLASAVSHPRAVYWCDAQLETLYDAYLPGYWNRTANAAAALRRERGAVERAYRVFCSSAWAADALTKRYPAHAQKLAVVPFPENMPAPAAEAVERAIAGRSKDDFRLLFVGVDWGRKGGDRAIALVESLRAQGVPATLSIIGSSPFGDKPPAFVRQLGFIDKSMRDGLAILRSELLASHFLVLPSRAEALGIALIEAHAHGVPTVSSDVGGIPAVVERGVNGFSFPFTDVEAVARLVAAYWRDEDLYRGLARSTRHTFARYYSGPVRMAQIETALGIEPRA